MKYVDPDGESDKLTKVTQGIVCIYKPIQMGFIGIAKDGGWNISSCASNFSINMKFSKSNFNGFIFDEGSSKGAYRHALWQAMITNTFGESTAIDAGWAHDPNILGTFKSKSFDSLEDADKYVDLMNNQIGRNIGKLHPFASYKKLAEFVLEEYKNNGLYTVFINEEGKYCARKTKLSEEEYLTAKNILPNLNHRGLYE